ncbi:ATP synthase F1 subunit epsilon [Alkalibaculum sp. M08DMB]|uniref:ATP synthase epsilon chain n=1 Tax=Alkalibaculum sporogenes TaxID=2655001 RepID=A0A6A7KBR5_9FIRM|nr:ATP synthase F1 subunit epsilon [Alkalibaculum sporogenes]MPW26999.1 ATP synthase F1 subunit epsilon [Alkalibaculum sporogenes]
MATYRLQIIAAERIFFDEDVEKTVFRGKEGDMAVLQNHTPLTTTLSVGELTIYIGPKNSKKATLINGFAKIEPDKTVILTDCAEWPDEIDPERAQAAKLRAEKRLKDSNADSARAQAALRRAIVRIGVSKTHLGK